MLDDSITACEAPVCEDGPTRAPDRGKILSTIGGLILLGFAALPGRLCDIFRPFSTDGAMFIYMGKMVSHGGRIGCELIDNKFPMVGLMTSGAWRCFGGHWIDYVLLQTALVLLATCLMARAAGLALGKQAVLPTACFCLVLLNFPYLVDGGFQLETMQVVFEMIAASAALLALFGDDARDSLVVGISAGAAALFKPGGLAVLIAFGAIMAARRGTRRRLAGHAIAAAVGLAIPAGVAVVYLVGADLIGQMPEICRQIGRYSSCSIWEPFDLVKWLIALGILGIPMVLRSEIWRRGRMPIHVRLEGWALAFALVWLLIEAASVIAQRRMYPYHFLVLVPPAALLFTMIPGRDRLFSIGAALSMPLALSSYGAWELMTHASSPTEPLDCSSYLLAHSKPGDRVWKNDMPRLLIETDLSPGSRFLSTFIWANDDEAPQEYCKGLLHDFRQCPPQYVLLPTHVDDFVAKVSQELRELRLSSRRRANYSRAWEELEQYVGNHYVACESVGRETIWQRAKHPVVTAAASVDDD